MHEASSEGFRENPCCRHCHEMPGIELKMEAHE